MPPNPPATMAGIERFMAVAMRFVRIVPDAPTIMPATIIAVLFSARPAAAAESPVSALRSEITTGMSAPPIGSTTSTPSTAAITSSPMTQISGAPPSPATTAQAMAPSSSRPLTTCCARPSPIGRPGRISWSLPNAISEPQNEIEPTIAENSDATIDVGRLGEEAVGGAELRPRDQRHRATADAVEQRHHLRHRGHLHLAGRRHAERGADHQADDDQHPVVLHLAAAWPPPRSSCRPRRSGCRARPSSGR